MAGAPVMILTFHVVREPALDGDDPPRRRRCEEDVR